MIIETHCITRKAIFTHQDYTMGCYDRIIRHHAILKSRKDGIPENICKLQYKTHNNMKYKNQILK